MDGFLTEKAIGQLFQREPDQNNKEVELKRNTSEMTGSDASVNEVEEDLVITFSRGRQYATQSKCIYFLSKGMHKEAEMTQAKMTLANTEVIER